MRSERGRGRGGGGGGSERKGGKPTMKHQPSYTEYVWQCTQSVYMYVQFGTVHVVTYCVMCRVGTYMYMYV